LGPFAQYSVLSALESTSMIAALMPNYNRADLAFEHGEGAYLFDTQGRRFLDFGAGIATSSLGHGHQHLAAAIAEQAAKVIHVSNLYQVPAAERLAAAFRGCELRGFGVFLQFRRRGQ
jgi:acetylornithine/succinyldiaminopimelate/putrescine aminotransferase